MCESDSGRVPLTIIGILFLLISTAISIHITQMDQRMAQSRQPVDNIKGPNDAFLLFNSDMRRAINYAAMDAVQQMGETPVIDPDQSSQYNPGGGQIDVAEFNRNWAKGMIMYHLNNYIGSNYMYNRYDYHGYAVNVEPLQDWEGIYFTPIYMGLDRKLELPLLTPDLLTPEETHIVYWEVNVPMNISIVNIATGEIVENKSIRLETLNLARYPLLESLTTEYETRLNGSNALMTETTAFAMGYTWARGFHQYYKPGGPKNIVDNEHLGLTVNGGLLLDQGFVFNSVDPESIIEYGMETKRVLEGKKDMDMAEFLSSAKLVNGSYIVDPNADAANSTGDPDNATKAMELATHFDFNATPITDLLNNDSLPGGSSTRQQINKIIPQVYNAKLATGVARHTDVDIGDHKGYNSNHKTYGWGEPDSMKQLEVLPMDTYVPGNLYGEVWEVTWTRKHVWRHYYKVEYECMKSGPLGPYLGTCTRTEYNEITAIDTRVDKVAVTLKAKENSKTSISLDYNGSTLSTRNDVVKAFTSKDVTYTSAHTDPGLEEAYDSYKSNIFDPNLMANIKNKDLDSDNCDSRTFDVVPPVWLKGEAQNAVDEINRQIRSDVHLSPDINYLEYPNPADAMRATAIDLTAKIKANQSRYVDKDMYCSGGEYSSCSAKTISLVREWYVDEVLYQVNEQYGDAADKIDTEIDSSFGESADGVRDANNAGANLLKSVMCFPIGFTMKAEHVRPDGSHFGKDELAYWEENVTLLVDMVPDYLFAENDNDDKELINLGVRNICLMGPKGVPVLPPPNYVVHFNSWMINVEGRIDEFTLFDVDNECHPHPIFGHEAQVYRRKDEAILDYTDNLTRIGRNFPIEFKFTTGTFIVVPPGPKGVGDRSGGMDESSEEFNNILRK